MIGNLIEFQVNQMVNFGFASTLGIVLLGSTILIVMLFRAIVRGNVLHGQA